MAQEKADFSELFLEAVGKPLRLFEPLDHHSNFRVGGRADYFFEATSFEELRASILVSREKSLPRYVIGGGNNLLFDDDGYRGLIIKNKASGLRLREGKREIKMFSGTLLADALQFSAKEGLSGFEFLAGIPGTIGGAVYGNAGAFGESIGNLLKEAILLNEKGEKVRVKRDYFEFEYRHSALKRKHDILLEAVFELGEGEPEKINSLIEDRLEARRRRHPPQGTFYAGSYFKNPVLPGGEKVPAAIFLEKVGAKKMSMGQAVVYPGHANFIINQGGASARDILRLAQELKLKVKEKFGVELEEEVIYLRGDFSLP